MIALIGLSVLCVTGCSSTRSVTADVRSLTSEVVRDTVREQVMVAVHDSVTITKTITITENEQGDTVKVVQVTDRDRVRNRSQLRDMSEKLIVRTDTVFVAIRDSTDVRNYGATESQSGGSALHRTLRWIVAAAFLLFASVALVRAREGRKR